MRPEKSENVFIAGQQPGLLGGPLYVTYKAVGAARLANEAENGRAVLWMETNDSDFDEISSLSFFDKENNLRRLSWSPPGDANLSFSFLKVDSSLTELLETFFNSARKTRYSKEIREMILDIYKEGTLYKEASAALYSEIFKDLNIEIFDPSKKGFIEYCRPMLLKEARLTKEGEQGNFFIREEGVRKAVFKKNNGWVFRDGLEADPEKGELVPNFRTRPVCQDAYFSTHTFVVGPSEEKYLGELDDLYQRHKVKKPHIKKRMSAAIVTGKTRRIRKRTGTEMPPPGSAQREKFIKRAVESGSPFDFDLLDNNLDEIKRIAEKTVERALTSELSKQGRKFKKELYSASAELRGKARAAAKAAAGELGNDAGYLYDSFYPFDIKQERVFTFFEYASILGTKEFLNLIYDGYEWNEKTFDI
ncbi:MAG: bacillithiol biosynthesis BshC [Fibrobacterota bacterium]